MATARGNFLPILYDVALRGPLEIEIRADGTAIWVRGANRTLLRVSRISALKLTDRRRRQRILEVDADDLKMIRNALEGPSVSDERAARLYYRVEKLLGEEV